MSTWQADLLHAARKAACWSGDLEVVTNEAHARTLIAFLQAFGGDPSCAIMAETRTPDRALYENARPADVLVLHPGLGVLFVEVKGWVLSEITHVDAGIVHRWVRGRDEAKDPWTQASQACSQLQAATRRVWARRGLRETPEPYFDSVVAFANIKRSDWNHSDFQQAMHPGEVLFAEDLAAPQALRTALLNRAKRKAGRRLPCSPGQLDGVREALGNSAIFKKHERRAPVIPSTLGALIDVAELGQRRFSPEQQDLAEAVFDGRSRIVRGVAGSGKSAVLAKNVANMLDRQLHGAQLRLGEEPATKRILVVCFNRSLVPMLKQMLREGCQELLHCDVPPCVDVVHMAGFESKLSKTAGTPLRYESYGPSLGAETGGKVAAQYCRQIDALEGARLSAFARLQYDSIYVDEGQDLLPDEYRLLLRLLREDAQTGEKHIVVFHDDAQNLYGRPRPVWSELGIQAVGRTSVMNTCYRNPRQIVEFAFNLLLGVAAETRVQMRGYADTVRLKENELVEELPDRWLVHFAKRVDGETPPVKLAATREEEMSSVLAQLEWLLGPQGVQPHEVLLVSHEPWLLVDPLLAAMPSRFPGVRRLKKFWGKGNPEKDQSFFEEGALTLSTVYSAKGHDCPVVLLFAADTFQNTGSGRAAFYVAATRAKLRLFVSGVMKQGSLAEEAKIVADLLRSQPAVAREEVEVVFEPAFRKGDRVRVMNHTGRPVGTVLADAQPKAMPSQKGAFQKVLVDFGKGARELTWPTAELEHFPS